MCKPQLIISQSRHIQLLYKPVPVRINHRCEACILHSLAESDNAIRPCIIRDICGSRSIRVDLLRINYNRHIQRISRCQIERKLCFLHTFLIADRLTVKINSNLDSGCLSALNVCLEHLVLDKLASEP